MNLKVYLRGLGIGIIVTAIIMLVIAGQNKASLSDSEIRERALALGMVDDSATLSQLELKNDKDIVLPEKTEEPQTTEAAEEVTATEENEEKKEPEATEEGTVSDGNEEAVEEVKAPEETEEAKEPEAAEEVKVSEDDMEAEASEASEATLEASEENTEAVADEQKVTNFDNGEKISFSVKSGEGSYTVAKHLSEIGLVSNATDFDNYLCRTGLDRRINAGSFSIPTSATEEEIANILAGR